MIKGYISYIIFSNSFMRSSFFNTYMGPLRNLWYSINRSEFPHGWSTRGSQESEHFRFYHQTRDGPTITIHHMPGSICCWVESCILHTTKAKAYFLWNLSMINHYRSPGREGKRNYKNRSGRQVHSVAGERLAAGTASHVRMKAEDA